MPERARGGGASRGVRRRAERHAGATHFVPHFGQAYVFMGPTTCWTTPAAPHLGHLSVGLVGAGSWTGMRGVYPCRARAAAAPGERNPVGAAAGRV